MVTIAQVLSGASECRRLFRMGRPRVRRLQLRHVLQGVAAIQRAVTRLDPRAGPQPAHEPRRHGHEQRRRYGSGVRRQLVPHVRRSCAAFILLRSDTSTCAVEIDPSLCLDSCVVTFGCYDAITSLQELHWRLQALQRAASTGGRLAHGHARHRRPARG
jgi:hypothetical protein